MLNLVSQKSLARYFFLFFLVATLAPGRDVFAIDCSFTPGAVPTPPDIAEINPQLADLCMTPKDLADWQPISDALANLKTKVCPGKQVGYNSSIDPSQLKEQYVYFSYGKTSMSKSAFLCFDKAIRAMESAGLQPCIVAALRSPAAQNASCMDRANSTVCGRTQSGSCTGSYGSCPHVMGIAMDFNDRTTCSGGKCGISQTWANKMRAAAAQANAYPPSGAMNDLPHLECRSAAPTTVPDGGSVAGNSTPFTPSPMQGMHNLLNQQPMQPTCQPGFMLLSGQCLPMLGGSQMQSPFSFPSPAPSYSNPPPYNPPPITQPPVSNSIPTIPNTNTNANTNTNTGNATSVADLINAIAYPTTTQSKIATGSTQVLNDSLSNSVQLQATPPVVSTTTVAIVQTNSLVPPSGQTFVSQDLSQATVPAYASTNSTTFAVLETLKQVLQTILRWLSELVRKRAEKDPPVTEFVE
jgi:hypothetical protein